MDPQGRVLLEQSCLALTDAEVRLEEPAGAETGVYVGVMHMEYIQYMTGGTPCLLHFLKLFC
jgi:acyl transferase domain-containing protein